MLTAADLDRIPMLRALNTDARSVLAERAVLRRFNAGQVLWRAGDQPGGLYFILEGHIRVVRTSGARQHVIHEETAGGTLGDIPFFQGGVYPATALAVSHTTCISADRATIAAAFAVEPDLAFALLARLAGRVREVITRLDQVTMRSVRSRLAAYLLARAEHAATPTFSLGTTQTNVAEDLGTVREVIVRALRSLGRDGVIHAAGRGRYRILAGDRLRAIAEEE